MLSSNNFQDDPPIVIVGAGIAGTAAALGAIHKGFNVLLITKYNTPGARTQRVKVNKEQVAFLDVFFDPSDRKDVKLMDELKETSFASIGSIEKYLHRKLQKIAQAKDSKLVYMTEKDGKLVDVNLTSDTVSIATTQGRVETIPFQQVLDASGGARTAYMLARGVHHPSERHAYEKDIAYQPKHVVQGTVSFSLSNNTEYKDKGLWRFFSRSVQKLKFSKKERAVLRDQFGWDKKYPPNVYVITNKEKTKFYVGGDVPDSFLQLNEAEKKEAVESWSKHLLNMRLGIKPEDLEIKDKDEQDIAEEAALKKLNMRRTVFPLRLTRITKLMLTTDSGKPVTPIADAVQSAYFHQAHGLNDALKSAEKFIVLLPAKGTDDKFDKTAWLSFVRGLVRAHDKRMQKVGTSLQEKLHTSTQLGFFSPSQTEIKSSFVKGVHVKTVANDTLIGVRKSVDQQDVPEPTKWVRGK